MSDRTFSNGEVIFSTGDRATMAYVIKTGTARIDLEYEGVEISLDVGPQDFIGDGPTILARRHSEDEVNNYRATATATSDLTVLEVPYAILQHEIDTASPLMRGWIISFADRALQVVEAALAAARK